MLGEKSEMSSSISQTLDCLTQALQRLPGIGPKSAERIAFYLLTASREEGMALAVAIRDLKTKIRSCSVCSNVTEEDPCRLCVDPKRDRTLLCVVEQPKDLLLVEKTGRYHGLYHVLMGRIAPLEGQHPEHLRLEKLVARVKNDGIHEVILATNPDLDGDGTALYIARELAPTGVRVTRIVKGVPAGSHIEYVSPETLADALLGRRALS
jgi:recombination protein RecR